MDVYRIVPLGWNSYVPGDGARDIAVFTLSDAVFLRFSGFDAMRTTRIFLYPEHCRSKRVDIPTYWLYLVGISHLPTLEPVQKEW